MLRSLGSSSCLVFDFLSTKPVHRRLTRSREIDRSRWTWIAKTADFSSDDLTDSTASRNRRLVFLQCQYKVLTTLKNKFPRKVPWKDKDCYNFLKQAKNEVNHSEWTWNGHLLVFSSDTSDTINWSIEIHSKYSLQQKRREVKNCFQKASS